MKIKIRVACMLLACAVTFTASVQAQKPAPAKPPGPGPRPSPYVLKKEFEPQMEQLSSRAGAAMNAASAARRAAEDHTVQLNALDSQMRKVEDILNSASFQIALTSDSLKETRFNMEEFRKHTEASLVQMKEEQASLKSLLWILVGSVGALALLLFVASMVMISKLKSSLMNQMEAAKMDLTDIAQRNQKDMRDEFQSVKSRIQGDVGSMRTDIMAQAGRDRDSNAAQISSIKMKLDELEAKLTPPPADGTE